MTVIVYFVLHVPSLKNLAEPMGSFLASPLSGSPPPPVGPNGLGPPV